MQKLVTIVVLLLFGCLGACAINTSDFDGSVAKLSKSTHALSQAHAPFVFDSGAATQVHQIAYAAVSHFIDFSLEDVDAGPGPAIEASRILGNAENISVSAVFTLLRSHNDLVAKAVELFQLSTTSQKFHWHTVDAENKTFADIFKDYVECFQNDKCYRLLSEKKKTLVKVCAEREASLEQMAKTGFSCDSPAMPSKSNDNERRNAYLFDAAWFLQISLAAKLHIPVCAEAQNQLTVPKADERLEGIAKYLVRHVELIRSPSKTFGDKVLLTMPALATELAMLMRAAAVRNSTYSLSPPYIPGWFAITAVVHVVHELGQPFQRMYSVLLQLEVMRSFVDDLLALDSNRTGALIFAKLVQLDLDSVTEVQNKSASSLEALRAEFERPLKVLLEFSQRALTKVTTGGESLKSELEKVNPGLVQGSNSGTEVPFPFNQTKYYSTGFTNSSTELAASFATAIQYLVGTLDSPDDFAQLANTNLRRSSCAALISYPLDQFQFTDTLLSAARMVADLQKEFSRFAKVIRSIQPAVEGMQNIWSESGPTTNTSSVDEARFIGRAAPYIFLTHAIAGLTRFAAKKCVKVMKNFTFRNLALLEEMIDFSNNRTRQLDVFHQIMSNVGDTIIGVAADADQKSHMIFKEIQKSSCDIFKPKYLVVQIACQTAVDRFR